MTDRHQSPSYPLRLPAELKHEVTRAAFSMGRSFNAEVIARLQASFEQVVPASFPESVDQAIADEMKERGGTEVEAISRLVMAGKKNGGTFFFATVYGKTTVQEYVDVLEASKIVMPPDSTVVLVHSKPPKVG